jgi:hypothetical protein
MGFKIFFKNVRREANNGVSLIQIVYIASYKTIIFTVYFSQLPGLLVVEVIVLFCLTHSSPLIFLPVSYISFCLALLLALAVLVSVMYVSQVG